MVILPRRDALQFSLPMAHPLTDAKLKLIRAHEHLDTMLEIIRRVEHGKCQIIPEQKPDSDMGVLRVCLSPKPSESLSLFIEDCLFNARVAVDYIVWQLVLANGKTPGKKNMFPLALTRAEFEQAIGKHRRLNGVSDEALAVIERLQPYHTGEYHPLALLRKLHNVDKHHKLNVTIAVARDTELIWSKQLDDGAEVGFLKSILEETPTACVERRYRGGSRIHAPLWRLH
jgi:hypothetical protein